ncbi:UNVERIFIED_CONTAM: hypothetical protein FKN15_063461 [Acipenser sinensis]
MPASCALGEAGETAGGGGGGQQEDEEEAGTMPSGVEGGVGCRGGVKASLHHTASPMRVQRNKGASACSHSSTSDYELSLDLKNKQIEMLEHKYGGHLISRRAACTIQTAFRQYQLSKNFEKIRNSLLESRLPHRISLRKLRVHNTEGFSAEKALVEGYNFMGIPLVRSPSLPTTISGALTELEDSFTEQVQSLAKSIDDALSTWSLKTMCSLQDVGTYQFTETFRTAASGLGVGSVEAGGLGGQESSVEEARPDALPHSGSTLMMAFRDVTVQIDNQNFCMSSSLMESTSLSLSNCLQQGGLEAKDAVEQEPELKEGPQDPGEDLNEFPAPPPSEEEEEVEPLLALQKVESTEPVVEVKTAESEMADNSSEQTSSSSTSTSAKSASEASSKEALQAMILSLPRYHCENPASCKSPTLSTDVMRKRLYRIGLNLFNVCVVDEMDFYGMELDEALRKFQAHIRVQGEAQKVERLIEAFSQRYCICNPDVVQQFHNPDTIFILAFAIILLNTDMYSPNIKPDRKMMLEDFIRNLRGESACLHSQPARQRYCICNPDVVQQFHNPDTIFILAFAIILLNTDMYSPNIKPDRKMMLEDFIRNLRGVDDGADIPREMVVGIYERIQQRELRSNEDHVTYVTKVEQSILGMKTVIDVNKAQKQAAHQREVFLFNDLMVILKLCPKKKSSATYTFCKAVGLQGMQFHLFENEYYPHGITFVSPYSGSDKKQVLHFCAQSAEELLKFVEDLKESIGEVTEMEQIRIEWELEKQQGTKTKNNGTQLELRGKQQGSPPGTQTHRAAGLPSRYSDTHRAAGFPYRYSDTPSSRTPLQVSIHNRLQTYQLSASRTQETGAPLGPLSNQRGGLQTCQPRTDLPLDTLIQCQQIFKVIVLDKGSHDHMEAILSHTPTHQLIQSSASTPMRSPEGRLQGTPMKRESSSSAPREEEREGAGVGDSDEWVSVEYQGRSFLRVFSPLRCPKGGAVLASWSITDYTEHGELVFSVRADFIRAAELEPQSSREASSQSTSPSRKHKASSEPTAPNAKQPK